MGKLVLFRPDGTAQHIKLDRDRVTIGRRPDNDVCLPHAAVSGEHAAVVTILDDSFLEDLGSTNGTLVNGKAVTKHFLRDRDEIDIGREILVYLAEDSAKVDAPPRAAARSAPAAPLRGPALRAPLPTQAIRVRSGPATGRSISLSEAETVIGRAGVQVVALRRSADELLVVPIEGSAPPRVNGMLIPPDGQRLVVGDILEIAGATLELVPLSDALA